MGDAVHVQVGGDHVAVEDEGQLADAALVEDLLDDVVVGLVELLLILGDHHVMAFLRVLSHPGQGERLSTHLAQGLAIVHRVVAEPEPLQVLRVLFHVLRKRGLGVHVVIAHIATSCSHSSERCVLWPCELSTKTQRRSDYMNVLELNVVVYGDLKEEEKKFSDGFNRGHFYFPCEVIK